jgi:hypothetical protein
LVPEKGVLFCAVKGQTRDFLLPLRKTSSNETERMAMRGIQTHRKLVFLTFPDFLWNVKTRQGMIPSLSHEHWHPSNSLSC